MKHKYTPEQLDRMENHPCLTDREKEVFALFYRRGWRIEDIAAELDVTRSTVIRDMTSIRGKLPESPAKYRWEAELLKRGYSRVPFLGPVSRFRPEMLMSLK